nr:hypothetical protein [Tanacetum cinerariifolium]
MSVLRSHAGWKTKHLKGMTLEEIKEKSIPVWKQLEDFVPMSSKEEGERIKRKGLNLDQRSAKRIKTFEVVSEEDLKGMMQLVPLEEVYVEALQFDREDLHQLWILVKEPLSIKQDTKDKEKELQLWTHNQAFIHDPLEWKLYDTCGVHHVFTKDQEIFMLVEKDYPLRKGLATVMICNKLQSKPLLKKEQREFYMSVLRSHAGWKTKHLKGVTLEEIKEKSIPVWKQLEDFVPMSSKEEDLKEMMQLVPLEEVYVEALQVKHPIIYWEIYSEEQREY